MERDKLAKFSPGIPLILWFVLQCIILFYFWFVLVFNLFNLNVLHVSIELAMSMNWKSLIFPPVLILSHWKSISLSLMIQTFDWVKVIQFAFVNFFNCFRPINSIVLLIEPQFINCWRSKFCCYLNFQQNCPKAPSKQQQHCSVPPHSFYSLLKDWKQIWENCQ